MRVHLYEQELQNGIEVDSDTLFFNNVLSEGWVTIDMEHMQYMRNRDQTIDVGVEYPQQGSMGYFRTPENLDVSYVNFRELDNYSAGGGRLTGVWGMGIVYGAPLRFKPQVIADKGYVLNLKNSVLPNPGNQSLKIDYILFRPGRVNIEILNVMGQKVNTLFEGYEQISSVKYWHGNNSRGRIVASGQYFVRFKFENDVEIRKVLVIR